MFPEYDLENRKYHHITVIDTMNYFVSTLTTN